MNQPANRLHHIKTRHASGIYYEDQAEIGYLLQIIHRLEQAITDQALAYQDPDNENPYQAEDQECPCYQSYQDDHGIHRQHQRNPDCPVHGEIQYSYSCTFYAHQFCDGKTSRGASCGCACHLQAEADR